MRKLYWRSSPLVLSVGSFSKHVGMIFEPDGGPMRTAGTIMWWQMPREMR